MGDGGGGGGGGGGQWWWWPVEVVGDGALLALGLAVCHGSPSSPLCQGCHGGPVVPAGTPLPRGTTPSQALPHQCPAPPVLSMAAPPPGTVWPSPPPGTLPHTKASTGCQHTPWPHPTPTWHSQRPHPDQFFFQNTPKGKITIVGGGQGLAEGAQGHGAPPSKFFPIGQNRPLLRAQGAGGMGAKGCGVGEGKGGTPTMHPTPTPTCGGEWWWGELVVVVVASSGGGQ